MLRFQHPEYFWLLLSGIVLVVAYSMQLVSRKQKIKLLGDEHLVQALMPRYSATRLHLKFVLALLALSIGIIGLANLQFGSRSEKINRRGIDVIIALDVSKSMLAKDMLPSRLEKAKQFVFRLMEKLENDRIGLLLFAGRAYVSVPLTIDKMALRMNLATANPDMVPTQGTVIGEAIDMARQSFNAKETKYKSIVIISDGEDHDEGVNEEVKKATDEGISIHTIGIGSEEGGTILDPETGENKTDENGELIISTLNEKELQEIASNGQGTYYRLVNVENTTERVAAQIKSSEQKNFGESIFTDYNSYFQYFLAACMLLLLIEFFIPASKLRPTV